MSKNKRMIFVEGDAGLRKGFSQLLGEIADTRPYRIQLLGSCTIAVEAFKRHHTNNRGHLLIDLDAPPTQKDQQLNVLGLSKQKDDVFFMIQEMEAWFLSQPQVLDEYYKKNISSQLPKKSPQSIPHPCEVLKACTKKSGSKKGPYHKVKHATSLLGLLNVDQLQRDFPEFQAFAQALQNP